ncbi:hypothetical protein DFH06DRAFT_1206645 [Mycena polygramma]|nr:hypothetical protein DFH06DRAFT_1206645 [Mycena polygramma]
MTGLASDADRLRIAIALTALKFKPADESCASYVLQLRSIFPPSIPAAPTTDGSWKNHALALEKELAGLKEKYEAERIKALANSTAPVSDTAPNGSVSVKRKPKKKATDKRLDAPVQVDLETLLEDLSNRPEFVCLPASDSLFSSCCAFQQLASALSTSEVAVTAAQRSLLLSTTIRALTAVSNVLRPILRSPELSVVSQASTLQTLSGFVHHLVSSSLPFFLRKPKRGADGPATISPRLNKFLDALISSIFIPVLESFSPLSRRYLEFLLPTTPPTILPADLRPDVLQLFQSAFSPLVSAPSGYEANLRATIALTALRELESLFPPRRTDDTHPPRTRDNRISGLVRKDTLWYLCTILHILFTPPKDWVPTAGAVSHRQIVDALARISSRCRKCQSPPQTAGTTDTCNTPDRESDIDDEGTSAQLSNLLDLDVIDEVSYEMLLGVMEQYWIWVWVAEA